jgi:hypothetical protein
MASAGAQKATLRTRGSHDTPVKDGNLRYASDRSNPRPRRSLLGPATNHAHEAIALQAAVRQQRRTTEPGAGLAVDRTAGSVRTSGRDS